MEAKNPACLMSKKSSNIAGKSDVNANLATPTPIIKLKMPDIKIDVLWLIFIAISSVKILANMAQK